MPSKSIVLLLFVAVLGHGCDRFAQSFFISATTTITGRFSNVYSILPTATRIQPIPQPARQQTICSPVILSSSHSNAEERSPQNHAKIFVIDPGLTTLQDLLNENNQMDISWFVSGNNTHNSSSNSNNNNNNNNKHNKRESQVAQETWNWCAHFVVPHNLCPWAHASVRESASSIQIFLVRTTTTTTEHALVQRLEESFEIGLRLASQAFRKQLPSLDPNKAIFFVVHCPSSSSSSTGSSVWDFESFYDWYVEAEETMINEELPKQTRSRMSTDKEQDDHSPLHHDYLGDVITWAPFHPDWQYALDPLSAWKSLEKQAPHPTVSIVSSSVVDKAGPDATEQIGIHNEKTLLAKRIEEWRQIYQSTVLITPEPPHEIGSWE